MESKDENGDNFNPEFVYSASPNHERINSTDDIFQFPDIQNLAEPASPLHPLHYTDNITTVNYEHNNYRLAEGSISPLGIQNMLGFGGANFQNNVVTSSNNSNGQLKISRTDVNNGGNHDDHNNNGARNCDDFINGMGNSDDQLHKWDLSIESQFGVSISGDFNVVNQVIPLQLHHHENIESNLKTQSKKLTHRNDTVMETSQTVPQLYNLSNLKTGLEMKLAAKDKSKNNEDANFKRKSSKGPKKSGYNSIISNTAEASRNDEMKQATKSISKGIVDRISYMMMDPNEPVNPAPVILPKQGISSLLAELRAAPHPTTRLIPPSFNRPSSTFPTNQQDSEPSEYDHEPSPDREADYPPPRHPYYDRYQHHLPPQPPLDHFQDSHPSSSSNHPGSRFTRRLSYPMPPHHYSHYGGELEEYDYMPDYSPHYYDPYYDPRNRQTAEYHQHHHRAYYEEEEQEEEEEGQLPPKRSRGNFDDHSRKTRREKTVIESSNLLREVKEGNDSGLADAPLNNVNNRIQPLPSSQSQIPAENNDELLSVTENNNSAGLNRNSTETKILVETFDNDRNSLEVLPTSVTTITADLEISCGGDGDKYGSVAAEEVKDEVEEEGPRTKPRPHSQYSEEGDTPLLPFARKPSQKYNFYPPPPPYETAAYPPVSHHYKRDRDENNDEEEEECDDDDDRVERPAGGMHQSQPARRKQPVQRPAAASNAAGPTPFEVAVAVAASSYKNGTHRRRYSGIGENSRSSMDWSGGASAVTAGRGRGTGRGRGPSPASMGGGGEYPTVHGRVLDTIGIQRTSNSNLRYSGLPSSGSTSNTMMMMPHSVDPRKRPRMNSSIGGVNSIGGGAGGMTAGTGAGASSAKTAAGRQPCSCKKSGCLKLYCECFRQQMVCDGCYCHNCSNLESNSLERTIAAREILRRDPEAFSYRPEMSVQDKQRNNLPGCSCKKSSCLKKYCECFNSNVMCTTRCRCLDCRNMATVTPAFQEEDYAEEEEQAEEYPMEALPSRSNAFAPHTTSLLYPRSTSSSTRNLNNPVSRINVGNNSTGARSSSSYPANEESTASPPSSPSASTTSMDPATTTTTTPPSIPLPSPYPIIPPHDEVISFGRDGGLSFFGVALGEGAKLAFHSAISRLGNAQLSEFITNALFAAAQDPTFYNSNSNNNNNNYQQQLQQNLVDGNNAMNTATATTAFDPSNPSDTSAPADNDTMEIRRVTSDLDIDITEEDFEE